MLLLLPIVAGALVGRAQGGRLSGLRTLRLRGRALVFAALAVQVGLGSVPAKARFSLVLLTLGLAGAWLALNLPARGRWFRVALFLMAAGWALNTVAMVPNRGMPVSPEGLRAIAAPAATDVADGHLFKHVPGDDGVLARTLGDSIPVRPLRAVVSVGDILMVAGITSLIAAAMKRGAPAGAG